MVRIVISTTRVTSKRRRWRIRSCERTRRRFGSKTLFLEHFLEASFIDIMWWTEKHYLCLEKNHCLFHSITLMLSDTRNTHLDISLEQKNDHWKVDGERPLSGFWIGFTNEQEKDWQRFTPVPGLMTSCQKYGRSLDLWDLNGFTCGTSMVQIFWMIGACLPLALIACCVQSPPEEGETVSSSSLGVESFVKLSLNILWNVLVNMEVHLEPYRPSGLKFLPEEEIATHRLSLHLEQGPHEWTSLQAPGLRLPELCPCPCRRHNFSSPACITAAVRNNKLKISFLAHNQPSRLRGCVFTVLMDALPIVSCSFCVRGDVNHDWTVGP